MGVAARPSLSQNLRGFSCPYEHFDESLFSLLIREHAAIVGRLFTDQYRETLTKNSCGLSDALENWIEEDFSIESPLDPAFGEALWAIVDCDPGKSVAAGCAIALYLGSQGLPSTWSAQLSEARTLRWGEYVIPRAESLAVESNGRQAFIEWRINGTANRVQLSRTEAGWESAMERMPQVAFDPWKLRILPRHTLEMKLPEHVVREALGSIKPSELENFTQALLILSQYVSAYIPWIGRTLTHAFLLDPKQGYVESGSVEYYLGFAHFSAYANPAAIAELLIHEASHQYFNILRLLGPFDDGTDKELYYSTAVRRPRPLDRIGVAYHAFANVLIYYRECLAGGIDDDGWCERHLERWTRDLRILEKPLRQNRALTNIGRSLCEPLIERLQLT